MPGFKNILITGLLPGRVQPVVRQPDSSGGELGLEAGEDEQEALLKFKYKFKIRIVY